MTFPPSFGWPFFMIFLFTPIIIAIIKNKIHARARLLYEESISETMNIKTKCIDKYIKGKPWFRSPIEREIYFGKLSKSIASFRCQCWIVGITVVLYSFPYSILITNISHWYIYNILFHILQISGLIAFYVTCFLDPGIITKSPITAYPDIMDESSPLINNNISDINNDNKKEDKLIAGSTTINSTTRTVEINNNNAPRSYCSECQFIRPTRSKHCYEIGKCVARFDHFDNLSGNAVGANNHRFYIIMLGLETIFYIWCIVIVIDAIIRRSNNPWSQLLSSIWGWTVVSVLLGFVVIMGIYKTVLFLIHTRMISVNSTTYEALKPQILMNSMNEINAIHDGSYIQGNGGINHTINTAIGHEDTQITEYGHYFNKGFWINWRQCFNGYTDEEEYFIPIKCKVPDVGIAGGNDIDDRAENTTF